MADVSIRGVTYTGVAKLDLGKSGGGSAIYYDTEDADAVAADILTGKKAYGASGLITGTRQPPSGSISITDNGSVDVTDYATALVNVQGGGGGPTASDAILTVTAPAGSTVTAAKGSATLVPTLWTTADGNQECALFVIEPEQFDSSTPWTVTATLGTDTATDTVTIDSNKQYNVSLKYDLYIIENGVLKMTGKTYLMTVTPDASAGNCYFQGTGNYPKWWSDQLTSSVLNGGYSKICADIVSYTGAANMHFGLSANNSSGTTAELAEWSGRGISTETHVEVDLTNIAITDSYVKVCYPAAIQCIIKNIYLKR